MFTLGNSEALWWLAVVPLLVIALALDGVGRRRLLERIGHLPQLQRMIASVSPARRRWKAVLLVVGVATLAATLAAPEAGGTAKLAPRRGLDLVVALDFSRSMLAADVYPSRLERAKRELDRLIDGLKGDRVGLVAFAGVTLSYPLTSDYAAAKLFWRDLGPDDVPVGGSNLGGAIDAALDLLEHGKQRRRADGKQPAQVIVLLTDGADTEGDPLAAAKRAASRGVKVYPVGIGTSAGEFVVLRKNGDGTAEYLQDEGQPVRMKLDTEMLSRMASLTGGDFFQVDPERFGVERVQRAIAALQRIEEEARYVREPDQAYWVLLAPALGLLLVELLLGDRRRRAPAALLLVALAPGLAGFDFPVPERQDPDVALGNRLLEAGKAEQALAAYDRAIERLPDDPAVHYNRGSALFAAGKMAEAQREFLRASEATDPALKADAIYNMGNALLRQQRTKEALEAYKRVLGLRPEDRRAKWNYELALRRLKEEQQKQQQQNQQQQNQPQQNQPQQNQPQQNQQQQNQQQQDQPQQNQQPQNQPQQNQPQEKPPQQNQPQEKPPQPGSPSGSEGEKKEEAAKKEEAKALGAKPVREIDRQDAEAVLDAFERVEPTVQKDVARRRAGNRRPRKDW